MPSLLNVVITVSLALATGALLTSLEYLSFTVIHPNCCVENFPSRASNRVWESLSSPTDVGINDFEVVEFNTPDGRSIKGWLIPSGKKRRSQEPVLAVLVHDSGADKRQVLEIAAGMSKRLGWTALLFDTQETEVSAFGHLAAVDTNSAVNFVKARSHEHTRSIKKVVVLGLSVGAAAGMAASIKDTAVHAFISVSMPTSAHQFWQSKLQDSVEQLKDTVPKRLAVNQSVGWQARLTHHIVELFYQPMDQVMQDTTEGSNFMAKLEHLSKGWFIDLAAQYTVIRGAGYRAWLQGHVDPHKIVHRLQPRGFLLVHGKHDKVTPIQLVQSLYHRAGSCHPKLAKIQSDADHQVDVREDNEFWDRLMEVVHTDDQL